MEQRQYVCPKCGCLEYDSEQVQTTGGNLSRIFDIQNKRFMAIECRNCGYTELYRANSSTGMDILDFLMGGH